MIFANADDFCVFGGIPVPEEVVRNRISGK